MELIICFIDDSDFEHDLMKKEIAPQAPGLTFVQAYTFEEAQDRLGKRSPYSSSLTSGVRNWKRMWKIS